MARPDKEAAVAELADKFRSSGAVLLTEYRGLSVADLRTLRRSLAGNAEYAVVKNTLAAIAARQVGLEALADDLTGPTALTFVTGEPVEAAKAPLSKAAYLFAAPASKAVRTVDALREKQETAA